MQNTIPAWKFRILDLVQHLIISGVRVLLNKADPECFGVEHARKEVDRHAADAAAIVELFLDRYWDWGGTVHFVVPIAAVPSARAENEYLEFRLEGGDNSGFALNLKHLPNRHDEDGFEASISYDFFGGHRGREINYGEVRVFWKSKFGKDWIIGLARSFAEKYGDSSYEGLEMMNAILDVALDQTICPKCEVVLERGRDECEACDAELVKVVERRRAAELKRRETPSVDDDGEPRRQPRRARLKPAPSIHHVLREQK